MVPLTSQERAEKAKILGKEIIQTIDSREIHIDDLAHHLHISGNPEWAFDKRNIAEYIRAEIGRGMLFTRIKPKMDVELHKIRYAGILQGARYGPSERKELFRRMQELKPENEVFTYVHAPGIKPYKSND